MYLLFRSISGIFVSNLFSKTLSLQSNMSVSIFFTFSAHSLETTEDEIISLKNITHKQFVTSLLLQAIKLLLSTHAY
ncbi:CLUMA_CG020212, isoform A [Clunio marinus]|uniref:CLUMA_CG020212, isoform A n=1 Tax=Clunio marinus TaxID=568069 RepID=A0A1J1J4B4_9DIPT|nr:CLUMA_CG020212, isoform A [Clunio marinus]